MKADSEIFDGWIYFIKETVLSFLIYRGTIPADTARRDIFWKFRRARVHRVEPTQVKVKNVCAVRETFDHSTVWGF